MSVELLVWSGCPSHDEARTRLRAALDGLGRAGEPIRETWVETDELAQELGFVGSPTIRVDGHEVIPVLPGAPTSLSCRVYRTRAGKYTPLPDPDDLRENLSSLLAARA
jgi:hypothetical protein